MTWTLLCEEIYQAAWQAQGLAQASSHLQGQRQVNETINRGIHLLSFNPCPVQGLNTHIPLRNTCKYSDARGLLPLVLILNTSSGHDPHHKGLGLVCQSQKLGIKIWFDSNGILQVLCPLKKGQNNKKKAPELKFHHHFLPLPHPTPTRFYKGLASIPQLQLFNALLLPSSVITPRSCSRRWKGEPWLQMKFLSSPEQHAWKTQAAEVFSSFQF